MKRVRFVLLAAVGLPAAAFAQAGGTGLTLTQGRVFSDAVGSVVEVSVANAGTSAVSSAVVTCQFSAGSRGLGSATTTLYNILPGQTGADQVHFMGPRSDKAECHISSTGAGSLDSGTLNSGTLNTQTPGFQPN